MRRGDIYLATLSPARGTEARVYPFQVLLPATDAGLDRDSKALSEQVRSIDVERIGPLLGRLTPRLADALDDALRLHLNL